MKGQGTHSAVGAASVSNQRITPQQKGAKHQEKGETRIATKEDERKEQQE